MQQNYESYMKKCFELAKKGQGKVSPNPLVGCVILDKNGNEIANGYHKKYGGNHAERDALLKLKNDEAQGGTLIVNLEPCSHFGKTPPCADLIIEKGLKTVVIAMKDVNPIVAGNGIKKLKNAGIEIVEHVLEDEAKELNEIFIKNMTKKEIFVALKTATTLDGKIATKTCSSKWITQEDARSKGKKLRTLYDCVLTTASTVLADNPKFECDIKVLIDRTLKCPFDMQYFKTGKIYVITEKDAEINSPENVEFIKIKSENTKINLKKIFEKLYEKGIRSVFVEAGGKLNGEIVDKDLADKIYQFIAPKIIGDNFAKNAYENRDIQDINFAKNYKIKSVEKFEKDILLTLTKN